MAYCSRYSRAAQATVAAGRHALVAVAGRERRTVTDGRLGLGAWMATPSWGGDEAGPAPPPWPPSSGWRGKLGTGVEQTDGGVYRIRSRDHGPPRPGPRHRPRGSTSRSCRAVWRGRNGQACAVGAHCLQRRGDLSRRPECFAFGTLVTPLGLRLGRRRAGRTGPLDWDGRTGGGRDGKGASRPGRRRLRADRAACWIGPNLRTSGQQNEVG